MFFLRAHRFNGWWILLALAFTGLAQGFLYSQTLSFSGRLDYLSRTAPQGIIAGDFNGDMILDLAVTNSDSDKVSIYFGDGAGRFTLSQTVPVGARPKGIALLNRNNRLDLVVANSGSNSVSILVNNGRGVFEPRPALSVGMGPEAVAVADLNGDGRPDLVVANTAENTIRVGLGQANGGFSLLAAVPVGARPQALAIGLIDRDTRPDVAVVNNGSNTVTLLFGTGTGTFRTPVTTMPVEAGPKSLVLADFDRDNQLDLAIAHFGAKLITLWRGKGDGTFFPPTSITLPSRPTALVTTDFNRDLKPDLAVTMLQDMDLGEAPMMSVFLGNGDMRFTPSIDLSIGFGSNGLIPGDFYRDGRPSLAATSATGDVLSVWRGLGDGTFLSDLNFPAGSGPVGVASGDLNGDGIPDVVTANFGNDSISVALGLGDGTFRDTVDYALGPPSTRLDPTGIALADLNGDRFLDVVVSNAFDNAVVVLLGNGNGTFRPPTRYAVGSAGTDPRAVVVADMNGDAIPDIITANFTAHSVSVLIGRGDGTFGPALSYPLGPGGQNPRALTIVDIDYDGILDVMTANFGSANLSVLRGVGMGGLGTAVHTSLSACGQGPHGIAVDDFNGDGLWDVVVGMAGTYDVAGDRLAVMLGNADAPGTFATPRCQAVGLGPTAVITSDFNLDGKPDIAVVNGLSSTVAVLSGVGDGTFRNAQFFGVGAGPIFLATDDFNLDGQWDVGVANAATSTVSILLNTTY